MHGLFVAARALMFARRSSANTTWPPRVFQGQLDGQTPETKHMRYGPEVSLANSMTIECDLPSRRRHASEQRAFSKVISTPPEGREQDERSDILDA